MSGAVTLSSVAALRSGSGLVTAVVPASIQAIVASYEPSIMTSGLECGADGHLTANAGEPLPALARGWDAAGIGPGLGRDMGGQCLVAMMLSDYKGPLVLDADALYHYTDLFATGLKCQCSHLIFTPHPGEFSRMTGLSIPQIEEHREAIAAEYARQHEAIVVLKGHRTIVTDGTSLYVNAVGNSGMATGGSGDVLTGIITSLLGQGLNPLDAAALGVFVHGYTGDLAAAELSQRGMIASDLLKFLPRAWLTLERAKLGYSP